MAYLRNLAILVYYTDHTLRHEYQGNTMNALDELIEAISRSDAVLFVGAGLSIGAGLPG
jgi:hypothetical protein